MEKELNLTTEMIIENAEKRPWGIYRILLETPYTKVKEIVVNPNQKLSLQYHNHRSEVWTIVKGDGVFTNGKNLDYVVFVRDVIEIKQGDCHRITAGDEGVTFIEVQLSPEGIFDEDDIVRIEDKYGR